MVNRGKKHTAHRTFQNADLQNCRGTACRAPTQGYVAIPDKLIQFLHGSIAAVFAAKRSPMNLSTSVSINSPFTTQAFSVITTPLFESADGSRKMFQGEPHFRVS